MFKKHFQKYQHHLPSMLMSEQMHNKILENAKLNFFSKATYQTKINPIVRFSLIKKFKLSEKADTHND